MGTSCSLAHLPVCLVFFFRPALVVFVQRMYTCALINAKQEAHPFHSQRGLMSVPPPSPLWRCITLLDIIYSYTSRCVSHTHTHTHLLHSKFCCLLTGQLLAGACRNEPPLVCRLFLPLGGNAYSIIPWQRAFCLHFIF